VSAGTITPGGRAELRDQAPARGEAISQAGERRSSRIESLRAVAALSVVASYSLYLWHVPIIRALQRTGGIPHGFVATAIIAVPLAIGVALASYWLIEAPFLRLRRQWARSSAPQEQRRARPEPALAERGGAAG